MRKITKKRPNQFGVCLWLLCHCDVVQYPFTSVYSERNLSVYRTMINTQNNKYSTDMATLSICLGEPIKTKKTPLTKAEFRSSPLCIVNTKRDVRKSIVNHEQWNEWICKKKMFKIFYQKRKPITSSSSWRQCLQLLCIQSVDSKTFKKGLPIQVKNILYVQVNQQFVNRM